MSTTAIMTITTDDEDDDSDNNDDRKTTTTTTTITTTIKPLTFLQANEKKRKKMREKQKLEHKINRLNCAAASGERCNACQTMLVRRRLSEGACC